jgi:Tfp pilus assembly protein PilX
MTTRTARRRPQGDDGFAMYFVIMSMAIVLTISAALAAGSLSTSVGVNKDDNTTRAFQAAEAGAQTAIHRLNLIQPATGKCVTTAVASPQTSSNWCAMISPETVGSGETFTYQTSVEMPSGCTGSTFGTSTSERCVIATGSAGGISRRVIARVVSATGAQPFPVAGILGLSSITIGNNAKITGSVGSNGQVTVNSNASITGSAQIWANGPAPTNPSKIAGGVTRVATQFSAGRPNMINPLTGLDSATSNDNARLLAGANPADPCSGGSGACYTNNGSTPRYLNFVGKSVTLGGGVYNFCRVNFFSSATINVAVGARIMIFLDSPDRPGSGCTSTQGQWAMNDTARISIPSGDPSDFEVIAYGSATNNLLSFDNNSTFVGALYAPFSTAHFYNNSAVNGGVTALNFLLDDNGATYDSRVANLRFASTLLYFRGSWHQCNSQAQSVLTPATGCP